MFGNQGLSKNEKNKIASDFCYFLECDDHKEEKDYRDFDKEMNILASIENSFESDGWDVTYDSYEADELEINNILEDLYLKQNANFNVIDQYIDEEYLSRINSDFIMFPFSDDKISSDSVKELAIELFTVNNDNCLPQHFVYAVAKNTINNQNVYVIAYRGTPDNYTKWVTNFLIWPTEFLNTGTEVHTGFELYRKSITHRQAYESIIDEIENDESENKCVIVTGHSLGASIAVLETAALIENEIVRPENLYTVTFGELSPGNEAFADYFGEKIKNYVWFWNVPDYAVFLFQLLNNIVPIDDLSYTHFHWTGFRPFITEDLIDFEYSYFKDRHYLLEYWEHVNLQV